MHRRAISCSLFRARRGERVDLHVCAVQLSWHVGWRVEARERTKFPRGALRSPPFPAGSPSHEQIAIAHLLVDPLTSHSTAPRTPPPVLDLDVPQHVVNLSPYSVEPSAHPLPRRAPIRHGRRIQVSQARHRQSRGPLRLARFPRFARNAAVR